MRNPLLLLGAILLSLSPALAADPDQHTITVSGDAVVYAAPDKATVSVGVQEFDANLQASKDRNDQESANLLTAIKGLGIDEKDIKTSLMDVRVINDERNYTMQIMGYQTTRMYTVKLNSIKLLMPLVDAAFRSGANRMDGFSYDTTQLKDLRSQARTQAIADAKAKADEIAQALGCEAGKPISITDNSDNANYYGAFSFGGGGGGGFGGGRAANVLPAGQLTIQARVSITFELKDTATK